MKRMKYIRRSEERGNVNFGWLTSKHSFSFGHYYDPKHMGVSALRVINDDTIMPGQGFDMHGHRDMEIITYVVEGALEHEDSTGNRYIVPAGEVQRMSAGRGIMHSEFNASSTDEVRLLQIWIKPNVAGIAPSYEQKTVAQRGVLTPLVSPAGDKGTLSIHQDASISRLVLTPQQTITLTTFKRIGYLHIVKGKLHIVTGIESGSDEVFNAGDGFALDANQSVDLLATQDLEALWFDLPLK
jgi:redox-sensitive bicupin YhaK (pirin superfamily)